jgi:fructan beta-fructosidase
MVRPDAPYSTKPAASVLPLTNEDRDMKRHMLWVVLLLATAMADALAEDSAPRSINQETYRPQFHYTVAKGWINDPIGLVHYAGEYHLFNDHNPFSCNFPGGKTDGEQSHWSHAVSTDLVHWKRLPIAVYPDTLGACWSGSGVVDWNHSAGFQEGRLPRDSEKTLVLLYTSAGKTFGQSMVYSNDRGRTWKKYEANPVVKQLGPQNRDPKVFWHEPTKRWIMVLYLGQREQFAMLRSTDLKQWERLADFRFPGGHECPELFELAVDGRPNDTRWVIWEGGGRHMIGQFDGRKFTPETEVLPSEWGKNCYAGQTFNDTPDGRRVFIGWMARGQYPDMPFNQQMTFPREFTLHTTDAGIRLFASPVDEIEKIRDKEHHWADLTLTPESNPLASLDGQLWDLETTIELETAEAIELNVRGMAIGYDVKTATLSCLGKKLQRESAKEPLKLRLLIDRTSVEIFVDDGRYVMSFCFVPEPTNRRLSLTTRGGTAKAESLTVWELTSIWKP